MEETKLYLYMARRDKKGIRLLAIFQGPATTTRVEDLNVLGLDQSNTKTLQEYVDANQMYYETWVEPAANYMELTQQLSRRGFSNLPKAHSPVLALPQGHRGVTSSLRSRKTMTQRKKS